MVSTVMYGGLGAIGMMSLARYTESVLVSTLMLTISYALPCGGCSHDEEDEELPENVETEAWATASVTVL
jgi:hypothetical protein